MGEMWKDPRKEPLTRRCAWCGLISHDNHWHPERRKGGTKYTHGICPPCRNGFYPSLKPPQTAATARRKWTSWGMVRIATSFVVLMATRWFKLRG